MPGVFVKESDSTVLWVLGVFVELRKIDIVGGVLLCSLMVLMA